MPIFETCEFAKLKKKKYDIQTQIKRNQEEEKEVSAQQGRRYRFNNMKSMHQILNMKVRGMKKNTKSQQGKYVKDKAQFR